MAQTFGNCVGFNDSRWPYASVYLFPECGGTCKWKLVIEETDRSYGGTWGMWFYFSFKFTHLFNSLDHLKKSFNFFVSKRFKFLVFDGTNLFKLLCLQLHIGFPQRFDNFRLPYRSFYLFAESRGTCKWKLVTEETDWSYGGTWGMPFYFNSLDLIDQGKKSSNFFILKRFKFLVFDGTNLWKLLCCNFTSDFRREVGRKSDVKL